MGSDTTKQVRLSKGLLTRVVAIKNRCERCDYICGREVKSPDFEYMNELVRSAAGYSSSLSSSSCLQKLAQAYSNQNLNLKTTASNQTIRRSYLKSAKAQLQWRWGWSWLRATSSRTVIPMKAVPFASVPSLVFVLNRLTQSIHVPNQGMVSICGTQTFLANSQLSTNTWRNLYIWIDYLNIADIILLHGVRSEHSATPIAGILSVAAWSTRQRSIIEAY